MSYTPSRHSLPRHECDQARQGHDRQAPGGRGGSRRLIGLVLSSFINPIGASDQAWGAIATVRGLVQEP